MTKAFREEDAVVLMVDDDNDDRLIASDAFEEIGLKAQLKFLGNGEELLAYLAGEAEFSSPEAAPRPNVILLDINMPRVNGIEALYKLKENAGTRAIPVVMLTNSGDPETIRKCYEAGASSYIRKPLEFSELKKALENIRKYWLETVAYPTDD